VRHVGEALVVGVGVHRVDHALDDAEASVDDDSASQVVALDDEEDAPRPKNRKKAVEDELDDLKDQLEEETAAKERAIKAKRAADTELEELKDQLEESEERVLALEDQKRKAALEAEEFKKKHEAEASARGLGEEGKSALEKELIKLRGAFEEERKAKNEMERVRRIADRRAEVVIGAVNLANPYFGHMRLEEEGGRAQDERVHDQQRARHADAVEVFQQLGRQLSAAGGGAGAKDQRLAGAEQQAAVAAEA